MLAQACMQSEYYDKVVDAVRFYSRMAREVRPFETLVNLMYQRPISPQFQVRRLGQSQVHYLSAYSLGILSCPVVRAKSGEGRRVSLGDVRAQF